MNKNDGLSMTDQMFMQVGKAIKDGCELKANMRIELFDKDGNLKEFREVHNTVTNDGHYGTMDLILAVPTYSKPNWMAVGTGSPSGTLLGAEVARVVLDSKTRLTNVLTMICTFPAGTGTNALTEAGIFDVVTPNTINMWLSGTFAVINKQSTDSLVITWTLTQN